MVEPVLTLTTTPARLAVSIDGKLYRLRGMEELQLTSYLDLQRLTGTLDRLWKADAEGPLTPAEQDEMNQTFVQIAQHLLDAPAAVLGKLTDLQRLVIYQKWLTLPNLVPTVVPQGRRGRKVS